MNSQPRIGSTKLPPHFHSGVVLSPASCAGCLGRAILAWASSGFRAGLLCTAVLAGLPASAASPSRAVPAPLPDHPGNVFLAGEDVSAPAPAQTAPVRLLDYDDKVLATVEPKAGRFHLGRLPVGFYRLQAEGASNWSSLAVLARLSAPTPADSPVALDVAMAWFYTKEKMEAVSSLCALAGINWVRDRLAWGQMEPRKGEWASENRYDHSAAAQSRAGLRVLQVNHSSPSWATAATKRFPPDLRDVHRFHAEMARRWRGQVAAFEPWNEADISVFGGHTGSEMASLQKAAFLGLRSGNPEAVACLNVWAMHNLAQLADFHDNEAWAYFDTFNLHHYARFEEYPGLYADFRAVCAGRPLWVTEFALPVKWAGDSRLQEPTLGDSRLLAERVAKAFACSLHEGAVASFYFLLPHYVEGQTQFGLLRPDLTPRPGYAALAAVGRLLANATPAGKFKGADGGSEGYLFRARPDGQERQVLVAWASGANAALPLPEVSEALFDHLGRPRPAANRLQLSSAPIFAVFQSDVSSRLPLERPPAMPPRLAGAPCPVVLQAVWPESKTVLARSAYRWSSETNETLAVFAYNFGSLPVSGALKVLAPPGWKVSLPAKADLAPGARAELPLLLDCRGASSTQRTERVRIDADFGAAGRAVLSVRLLPEPSLIKHRAALEMAGARDPARWQPMISGGGPLSLKADGAAVVVEAKPAGADRWVYPRLVLAAGERPPSGAVGLVCSIELLAGQADFRAIFDEDNGSSYVVDLLPKARAGQTVEAEAFFENAAHGGGWSKPDTNHRLDAPQIAALKIGCNLPAGPVKYRVSRLRWLTP